MRKLFLLTLLLLFASVAHAQSSTVSLSVTDQGSVAWANGTYSFTLVAPGTATWPGGAINSPFTGSLSGSGTASVSVPDTNTITPGPASYTVRVCVQPGITNGQCFTSTGVVITGATPTLSLTPPAVSIPGTLNLPVTAYADAEITAPTPLGFIYFQPSSTTAGVYRQCSGVTGNACTTWTALGGSSSGITGSGTPGFMPLFVSPTSVGNSHCDDGVTTASTVTCSQNFAVPNGNIFTGEVESTPATGGSLGLFCSTSGGPCSVLIGLNDPNESVQVAGASISEVLSTQATRSAPTITDTVGTAAAVTPGSVTQRVVTTGTDTILNTDRNNRVAYNSTTAVAVTLPPAGSGGFAGGFNVRLSNQNTGTVTVTPASGTINGNATLVLLEGQFCFLSPSASGTSYAADCGESQVTAGAGITLTRAVHGLTIAASASGCTASGAAGVLQASNGSGGCQAVAATDNGTTIAATEPFSSTGVITGSGGFLTNSGSVITWTSRTKMQSPADGILELTNNATTSFTRVDFGGTTSSFPALQVNGTGLQAELADGSAQTAFSAATFSTSTAGITTAVAYQVNGTPGLGMWSSGANILDFSNAGGTNDFELASAAAKLPTGGIFAFTSTTAASAAADTGMSRDSAAVIDFGNGNSTSTSARLKAAGYISAGTKFTASGCSNTTTVGGATAGSFASGTSGTCTVTITMGNSATAPNGWACRATDITTAADIILQTTPVSTTQCTVSGTTVSGDLIVFSALGY